jgi:hypothetical protein
LLCRHSSTGKQSACDLERRSPNPGRYIIDIGSTTEHLTERLGIAGELPITRERIQRLPESRVLSTVRRFHAIVVHYLHVDTGRQSGGTVNTPD